MTTASEPALLSSPASQLFGKIHQGDCLEQMRRFESATIDLVFADPPFNIGYKYDKYHDEQDDDAYLGWCRDWIEEIHRLLKPGGTFWLAIGDEFAAELKVAAQHQVGFTTRSWVVWYYTFGVNCKNKFSRSHVHLFHFVKDPENFTFNAEEPLVRIPSARALVYGDKRANPKGRLPDDTWIIRPAPDDSWVLRPQDLPDGFQPGDDTWYFARVAGTFKERQGFHGCQMPEQLLGRIIRVSSNPGDVVFDPFAGSGTTLAVAKKLGRTWIGCELSEEYARAATERLEAIRSGDELDGPADPIASAPSTAKGRKLKSWESLAPSAPQASATDSDRVANNGHHGHPQIDEAIRTGSTALAEPASLTAEIPDLAVRPSRPLASVDGLGAVTVEAAPPPARSAKRELRDMVREAIIESYFKAHDGHSTDWLLANPQLQDAFHEACRDTGLIGSPADWNRELLRLRKGGAIPKRAELKKVPFSAEDLDTYRYSAEIAWRLTSDKFNAPSLDEIFCDPVKASFFDTMAKRCGAAYSASHNRWAALRLRKASRELVDEVKQFHFVFANRDFKIFHTWSRLKAAPFNGKPGIYMLRDQKKRALYIGQALDLGKRLAQHGASKATRDRVQHVSLLIDDDLTGPEYDDGFKEDLVRRYEPMWNVNFVALSGSGAAS